LFSEESLILYLLAYKLDTLQEQKQYQNEKAYLDFINFKL